MSEVSVLIATSRRPDLLAQTLDSLARMEMHDDRWDVIVIDNADEPATGAVVREAEGRLPVRLLVEPTAGKNHALNRGLAEARGALVAFTDDDVVVDRGWLRELCEGAARWPEATMFGGRILPQWPAACPEPAPHPFLEHAYGIADFDHPEGRYSSGYVYGANMVLRRAVFDEGWRFDPRMGPDGTDRYITGSETSLTVALEKAGHRAIYLPRALVRHQIRPEQLTTTWLHGRAFRKGRAEALKRGLGGGLRAVPREVAVSVVREYASWWRCRLVRDRRSALDHGLEYWKARGMVHQCRVGARPSTAGKA